MAAASSPPNAAGPREVVLGLFVVGQLAFLVLSNTLGWLIPASRAAPDEVKAAVDFVAPGWSDERGHAWDLMIRTYRTTRRWEEATGQLQEWSLFSPNVSRDSGFPAVVLRWDDEPWGAPGRTELLLSDNEPADIGRYFRVGYFRHRRVENAAIAYLTDDPDETPAERDERREQAIERHIRDNGPTIRAFLRWRLDRYQEHHPDSEPPTQVILVERIYRMVPAEEGRIAWSGPHTTPLARWRPGAPAVERYSVVGGRFAGATP